MAERIGVYVCECGPNIKEALHFDDVVRYAGTLKDVAVAKSFGLLCSAQGKEMLAAEIGSQRLTRLVIAACSPREHELTFRKILQNAGLNPYFLQVANIREHCSWVIKDKNKATDHAKTMIRAAVGRVVLHEPLEAKEITCEPNVLVIGSGVAGISAALALAQKQRKVYLVEKWPCIGGNVNRYGDLAPNLECSTCLIEHKLDKVLHDEQITLYTNSTVIDSVGFYGNYTVTINKQARYVDISTCMGCGACSEVCPVHVKNEFDEGMGERKAVYYPYPGALPNAVVIDRENCLRFKGQDCLLCAPACPFGAIHYDEKDEEIQVKVGAIILATGFSLFDPAKASQYGYGSIDDVYTNMQVERLVSSTGPTGGKIVLKNGQEPKRVAIIHCVGSRTKNYNEYCSEICCLSSLKEAHLIMKKVPGAAVTHFYSDFCLPGKDAQGFFNKMAGEKNVEFIRTKSSETVRVEKKDAGISIRYHNEAGKMKKSVGFDMVVLALAIEGSKGNKELARILDLTCDRAGFFLEESAKLSPVTTTTDGVLIAGCCQGPYDMSVSVAQGLAAAGQVLSRLVPGEKLILDPCVSMVMPDLCSGCKSCLGLCPYKAISFDIEKKQAQINEALCRGCGVCVAACPTAAIVGKHFTDQEIDAEIEAVTKPNG